MSKTTRGQGPDPIDVAVGARLRLRRQEIRMSQAELASRMGVTFQQVQKYERGANRVSASMLVRAAGALQCAAGEILGDLEQDAVLAEQLQLLALPGGVELLQAFAAIPDAETRAAVVSIARGLSNGAGRRGRTG